MSRFLGRACALAGLLPALWGTAPVHAAEPFVPDDVEVCPAAADLIDPEFDPGGTQLVWMNTSGQVKVAPLLDDGSLGGAGCAGEVVDTGAVWTLPGFNLRQGPEWGFSQRGLELFYTRTLPDGRFALVRAWRDGSAWRNEVLERGEDRGMAVTSSDGTDLQPRLLYARRVASKYLPYWRESTRPDTEALVAGASFNASSGGVPRWVAGLRALSAARADANGVLQAALYTVDDRVTRLLTSDAGQKDEVWLWRAPEWGGDWALSAVVDGCCLSIYREVAGVFTEVQRYDVRTLASGLSKIYSPEPAVVGGRSYLAFVAANAKVDPRSQLWVVAADPAQPLARRITPPDVRAVRIEPEWRITPEGAYVYYSQFADRLSALRRAATGLPF